MEEQDTIDVKKQGQVMLQARKQLFMIVAGCTLAAMALSFVLPKEYESTVLLRAKSQKQNGISLQAAAALSVLGTNVQSPTQGYIELMKSRNVLDPVIAKLDLPEEKKEKLDNKSFAKSNLKIVNTKGTDLIEVTGIGRTPEEAQQIAGGVIASFQRILTQLNQSEQSLMVKFLKERITIAKKEMEQAEQNLEGFRQNKKIFVPEAQSKAAMEKVLGYDKRLAEQRVQNQSNQVKLREIEGQLAKQNASIRAYKLADNETIQKMRNSIISKEMALVELRQRYTDKHPSVVLAQKEIEELNQKLKQEVANAVQAGTTSLNPIHAALLGQKVALETELAVGESVIGGLGKLQGDAEQEISNLSSDGLTYIGLERQAAVTREVYTVLVKNYEQTRIQEAMESMDIQVVDEADLPKKPSAPKKMLITAIGGVLGIMAAFGYVMVGYRRLNTKSTPLQ